MTRELAEQRVSERWEYLGLNKAACPIMFGMDVDNMVEHPEDYIEVANQGKALQQGIESLRVGDDSGGASSVCAPVEIFKSFSCVRDGLDGFIRAADWVVDRETAEYQGVTE